MLRRLVLLSAVALVLLAGRSWAGDAPLAKVASPDGRLAIEISVGPAGEGSPLCYRVVWRDKEVIASSRLGFEMAGSPALGPNMKLAGQKTSRRDDTWTPVCGEREEIVDRYNAIDLDFAESAAPGRKMQLRLRAYNEGVAFAYHFPDQPALKQATIASETTEFRLPGDYPAWATYSAQGIYELVPLSKVKPNCERPLPIQFPDGSYVAIAEARLVDFARGRLRPAKAANALQMHLGSAVTFKTPYTTPWRVVMVAETASKLLENNDLILNLNDPCAIADTSWIKPGKVIREVTLSTAGGKACVDFAAKQNLQYIEYDAGWYGHEYDKASDARAVNLDPKRVPPGTKLDLAEVIRYAKSKGVGVILYVNHLALERQLDEILPLYEQWGVAGVKYGFVNVGSQEWTAWLHEAVRKAAAHKLMVDVHDEYRPTGYQRTYPNLMTQEGIHGNECMPTATNNLVLPFTRFVCGPGDFTVCWYTPRNKNTHAHQLALSAIYFSPWQFLYWYDKPQQYQNEPETEFFRHLPTVWDETRVLAGEIGQYITVARRKGEAWFIGVANAGRRRTLDVPLAFLSEGRKYRAYIHSDAQPDGGNLFAVTNSQREVDRSTILSADCAANGGQAIRLVPLRSH